MQNFPILSRKGSACCVEVSKNEYPDYGKSVERLSVCGFCSIFAMRF